MPYYGWGYGGYGMGGLMLGTAIGAQLAVNNSYGGGYATGYPTSGFSYGMTNLFSPPAPTATSVLTPAQAAYYQALSHRAQALTPGYIPSANVAYVLSGVFSAVAVVLTLISFANPWWKLDDYSTGQANLVYLTTFENCWVGTSTHSNYPSEPIGPDFAWCVRYGDYQSLQHEGVDSLYAAGVAMYVLGAAACLVLLAALIARCRPRAPQAPPTSGAPPPPANMTVMGAPKIAAAALLTAGLVAVAVCANSIPRAWDCGSSSCVVPMSGFHCAIAAVACLVTAGAMSVAWASLVNAEFAKKLAAAGPPPPSPPAPTALEAAALALAPSLSSAGTLIPAADAAAAAEAQAGIVPPPAVQPDISGLAGDVSYAAGLAYYSGVPPGMSGVPLVLVMNGGVAMRKVVLVVAQGGGAPQPQAAYPQAAAAVPTYANVPYAQPVPQAGYAGYGAPPANAPGWGAGGGSEWSKEGV